MLIRLKNRKKMSRLLLFFGSLPGFQGFARALGQILQAETAENQ
jgi:hypothetical protein